MLTRLICNGVGCKIGVYFSIAHAYADDVVLLFPSRKGLQEILYASEIFGDEYQVSFNAKNTHCINCSHNYTYD